jgi:hypothetical protein
MFTSSNFNKTPHKYRKNNYKKLSYNILFVVFSLGCGTPGVVGYGLEWSVTTLPSKPQNFAFYFTKVDTEL